jgi:TetR/AcrR family transcriptional regulator, repressor for uid operon
MPKLSTAVVAERRQEILKASVRLFARRGFHQTSMRDLCQELKLSAGALYCYFPSKEAIVAAMIEADRQQWSPFFDSLSPDLTFEQTLDEIDRMAMEAGLANQDHMSLWWQITAEAMINRPVAVLLEQHYAIFTDHLTAIIKRCQGRGELMKTMPARQLAIFIIATFDGLLMRTSLDSSTSMNLCSRDFRKLVNLAITVPQADLGQKAKPTTRGKR